VDEDYCPAVFIWHMIQTVAKKTESKGVVKTDTLNISIMQCHRRFSKQELSASGLCHISLDVRVLRNTGP
jgi:hypothetical protein